MNELKVLVADDDPALLDLMLRRLARQGLRPDSAKDGRKALELIASSAYDLIVTDIYMPGVTGLELLRQAKEADPNTQVIVVTAGATLDNAIEALNNGAFAYLMKPFDHFSVFDNTVTRALQFRRALLDNQRMAEIQRRRGDMLEEEVTERVQQLQRRRREMMALLSSLPDGVLVVEEGGRVIMSNPAADAWLAMDRATAEHPLQAYLERIHQAWTEPEWDLEVAGHELHLTVSDLREPADKERKVVVIKESETEQGIHSPWAALREGLNWLSRLPLDKVAAQKAVELLSLLEDLERGFGTQAGPDVGAAGPWSEVQLTDLKSEVPPLEKEPSAGEVLDDNDMEAPSAA